MDLRDGPEEAAFRARLRNWLGAHLPPEVTGARPVPGRLGVDVLRAWTAALHRAGYTGLTWPKEYGGQDAPAGFQTIFLEETVAAGAPDHVGMIGIGVVGPTILALGTPAQRSRYLPGILAGDIVFCQGFSEPDAGSDLAAVRTRAVRDGDAYVVTGRKVWSSYAGIADECLLLCRTGTEQERHRGLTCLLLAMRTPGVTVRPLRQLTGDADFYEIELDAVRIPAGRLLGPEGQGWRTAMTGLAHERGTLGFTLAARLRVQLRRLLDTARELGRDRDPLVRDAYAALAVDVAGLRWTSFRMLSEAGSGTPGPESSVLKLSWSQIAQRMTALALDLLGAEAVLTGEDGFWGGYWQYHQLRSLANSIEGGTSDIQHNVIAERLLGLPRSQ